MEETKTKMAIIMETNTILRITIITTTKSKIKGHFWVEAWVRYIPSEHGSMKWKTVLPRLNPILLTQQQAVEIHILLITKEILVM